MKAKVVRGSGFRGALEYVMGDGKKPEIVGGNMTGGTPRELAAEFAAARRLRTDVKRPVWHCALALPAGERLDDDQWRTIAADFMTEMGFTDATQYIAVRHQGTDHDHVHIVASRIGLDGGLWHGQWEARKAIEATNALEQRHGLTITPTLGDDRAERKALTMGELNKAIRTGEEPPRQQLQRLIDEAAKNNPTAVDFTERLEMAGVVVIPNIARTGLLNGFSFELAGEHYKGSQLGAKYKRAGLQKAGVNYDKDRDGAELERRRAAAKNNNRTDGITAQTMQSLPDAIAALTSQSLTPLETLQSEVNSALAAYDQISATQRETLDALTTEMTKLTAQKFKTIAAAQEKQVQRLQNTTAALQTEMQDYRALMTEQRQQQAEMTAAYRMVVNTAEGLSAEADRLRPSIWKTLITLVIAAAIGGGAVLAGQTVLNEQAQPSATIRQEATWARTVWKNANAKQRHELQTLAR